MLLLCKVRFRSSFRSTQSGNGRTYAPPRLSKRPFQLSLNTCGNGKRVRWSLGVLGSSGPTNQPSQSRVIETWASLFTTASPASGSGSGVVKGETTTMDAARRSPHNWITSSNVERAVRPAARGCVTANAARGRSREVKSAGAVFHPRITCRRRSTVCRVRSTETTDPRDHESITVTKSSVSRSMRSGVESGPSQKSKAANISRFLR